MNNRSGASMTIATGVTANNGIYANGATLVVNGGEINGNRSGCHVLYAWNSNVTIAGGTFHNNNSGNSTTMAGGTTKLTINGGTFSIANGKSTNGWTSCLIDATDGGKYEINGGEFKGHFRVQANCAMEINGGTFENTHGEAYVNGGTVAVKGGTFTDAAAQKFATDNLAAGYELDKNGTVVQVNYAAKIGDVEYTSIKDAVAAVQDGETITILAGTHSEGTIKLPATLNNVTIKGAEGAELKDMTISAADGNAYSYVGLTFDGITFDNSRILLTGWRNGEETIENLTVTNCTFKNLNDNTNTAPVHISKDASKAVKNFTFTNNVIDGATGGQKSGIYAQVTGNVVVENNVINNVSFRPYVIQVTTDDGIADNFTVKGNTFSGSAGGRAQGLGNNAEGTDNVNLVVSNNIFKGITEAQQICYWNFNPETTTADLSKNYYDIDIVANPSKIYFNGPAADNYALRDMNVFPIYTALNENGTINTESAFTPKFYIAKVGDAQFETLNEAVAAVEDGGTITMIADETFTENNRYNNGGWWDGLVYSGDKSFTIDLGGFTIGQDGALNDYLMWFKNDGAKANTITLKNGTLDAGTTAYSALATASSNAQKITVNLENIKVINNISNGAALKIRAGAELNVKAGTEITGKDSYLGIQCWAATVNIYDGAKIYMNGTSSYCGCLAGASGGGTVNVYGGYGKGAKGGFIAMTSGGTINIEGGEWIANTDGSIGNNSNVYVLTAQSNINEQGFVGPAIINVTGGTFRGGMDAWVLNNHKDEKAELNISGGNFNADPATYLAQNYVAVENNGVWNVELAAAKIGETYYAKLADAVAAAADGATVTMLSDVELTETVKVVGKAITLDLNGKTVSGVCNSSQGYLVYIENGAGLTVKDGAVDGGGKLTYAQGTSNVGWTVAVMGNLTLESGTIELTGEWSIGYAVDVRPNAWGVAYTAPSVFTMKGGNVVSSDGAVRVASSSYDQYADVSASFVMNGGKIVAAWDGVFIQQSDTAYDVLNFTINGGTIESGLNPVRVYGPAPTSYVNGQKCMSINFNGGTMTYTGTETREWVIDGVLRVGGGSSIETIVENGNITAGEAFAQAQALPDGYKWEQDGEIYKVVEAPATGKISYRAYINDSESREAVQVDLENVYARNSLVVKLFDAEGNALTTTTLKQGGVEAAAYTCNIVLWGTASGSWDTEIHAEKLTVANYPQKGELWIDGNLVDTFDGILGKVTDAAAYQLPAYLALDCVYKEAKVGETYYATLADAVAAAEGETVTMLADVELTESLVIAAGKEVVLDLNGKTVSMADASGKGAYAIKNNGNLTIVDNSDANTGKITFNSTTPDNSFGYATSTIGNGGSLTVESGTIENTTVGGASYAIDGIWHTDEASLTINGGTIVANKIAVRQVPFSATANNVVTVNGGTLTGATAGLQLFNTNNDAKLAEVNIHGGEFNGTYAFYTSFTSAAASEDVTINIDGGEFNGYLYLYNGKNGSDEYPMTVSVTGGTFNGGAYIYTMDANGDEVAIPSITGGTFANDVTDYCADGYLCEANSDGTYGIVADPNYIATLVIDDAEGENYTNDTEKTVGTLTYKRTLINGKWNALYLPFKVELTDELLANYDFADYNQMISSDTNGDRVPDSFEMELFIYTSGTLDANYPYFVRPKNEEACSLNLVLTDATLYPANEISLVTSSVKNTFKLSGTYSAMDEAALAGKYAISIDGDWSYTVALKPYRLYLTITDNNGAVVASGASKSVRIVVRGEDGTTEIEGVYENPTEGMIFDLQGRRVLEPQKGGMYIINGKKVIF